MTAVTDDEGPSADRGVPGVASIVAGWRACFMRRMWVKTVDGNGAVLIQRKVDTTTLALYAADSLISPQPPSGSRRMRYQPFTLVVLAVSLATPLFAQSPRTLEIEDLFAVRRVENPQVSPDGNWVAYTSFVANSNSRSEVRLDRLPGQG
jgi:hypothetical protein